MKLIWIEVGLTLLAMVVAMVVGTYILSKLPAKPPPSKEQFPALLGRLGYSFIKSVPAELESSLYALYTSEPSLLIRDVYRKDSVNGPIYIFEFHAGTEAESAQLFVERFLQGLAILSPNLDLPKFQLASRGVLPPDIEASLLGPSANELIEIPYLEAYFAVTGQETERIKAIFAHPEKIDALRETRNIHLQGHRQLLMSFFVIPRVYHYPFDIQRTEKQIKELEQLFALFGRASVK